MVLLNLTREQAYFVHSGMNLGIKGLDEESYPPFRDHLESIKGKLEKQGIVEGFHGIR